ncbi:MAG: hypothetical protein IAF94_27015 [Pirellulaceae bacterium]|nr:hypothetical protein [Pirellulaceae bacterium]
MSQTTASGVNSVCTVTVMAKGFVFGFGDCAFTQGNIPGARFIKTFSGTATCADYSATDIPFSADLGSATDCDWSAATVAVTAI